MSPVRPDPPPPTSWGRRAKLKRIKQWQSAAPLPASTGQGMVERSARTRVGLGLLGGEEPEDEMERSARTSPGLPEAAKEEATAFATMRRA